MADKTEKFKEAKQNYLAAIKERGKALTRALKHHDEAEKYPSFVVKEEAARKTYYTAAETLQKSLTKTK